MKPLAVVLMVLAFSVHVFAQAIPSAEVNVSLRLPASAMIGEEISAALVIENKGTTACSITTGGDYRSTGYPQRIKVRVRDENLNDLPELPVVAYGLRGGGLVVTKTIPPGGSEAIDFPLECYVSFRKPGVYQVIASHDLGWPVDDGHPRLFAQAELVVTEPTGAQATAFVEKLFATRPPAPSDQASVFGYEINFEKQLSVLRHPAYLPALVKAAGEGSTAAVVGIGHIATPEATMALLHLLDHESRGIVTRAAQQILRRLPSAEDASQPALPGWASSRHQVDPLLPSSWDPRFDKPLLAAAAKMLDDADVEVVQVAALIMRVRGEAEHAPAILAALQKSLDIYQAPRTGPDANTLDAPKPQQALINALDALRQRGWRTKGGRPAEAIAWFRQLADPAIPPPEDESWKDSALVWIENGPAALRIAALQAIPHPMSDAYEKALLRALEDRDWGVQRVACEAAGKSKRAVFIRPLVQIVEMASERFLRNAALNAAYDCGARYELWQALTAAIPHEDRMVETLRALIDGTIDLPDSRGSSGNSGFTRDQRFAIRDAWRVFLAAHEAELAAGKRVRLTDHETISALTGLKFRPGRPAVEIKFPDGTVWPTRSK